MDQKKENVVKKVSLDGMRFTGPKTSASSAKPAPKVASSATTSSEKSSSTATNRLASVTGKPASTMEKQTSTISAIGVKRKKSKSLKKGNPLMWVLGCLIMVIVVISAVLIIRNLTNGEPEPEPVVSNGDSSVTEKPTEEEERITKETLEKYLDPGIEGYREDTFGENVHEAIVVSMHNKSEEKVSLMMEIIAVDKNGEIKDSSYVSAENMLPGETQSFPMFVESKIPMNELKDMEFKVYRANTYDATPSAE